MSMNRTHFEHQVNKHSDADIQRRLVINAQAIIRKTAIHEAGHAAAIYLGNQQKGLAEASFQIEILPQQQAVAGRALAKVTGGRLLNHLPTTMSAVENNLSAEEQRAFQCAFEADIINILAGPLAEAKYVAFCDDEPINPRLLNMQSLQYYGGAADLAVVQQYLNCFSEQDNCRADKINALFQSAFQFINQPTHWRTIIALADYILTANKAILEYQEISTFLANISQSAVWIQGSSRFYPANLAYPPSYQLAA